MRTNSSRYAAVGKCCVSDSLPLIVHLDDEPVLRTLFQRVVSAGGYDVLSTVSCAEALAALADADQQPVMYVIDIYLGTENGIDFAQQLRRSGYAGVVVILSALALDESQQAAVEDGNMVYWRKPLSPAKLSRN